MIGFITLIIYNMHIYNPNESKHIAIKNYILYTKSKTYSSIFSGKSITVLFSKIKTGLEI